MTVLTISVPYKQFLGYKRGEDGLPEIIPEEAETVKLIYRLFLEGKTAHGISRILTDKGIPSPAGKSTWQPQTILSILQNEKYSGNALLQKGYTEDFLTKKRRVNNGEIPQYWVENSHPGIIEPEVFDIVQAEIKRRNSRKGRYSGSGFFAGRIICADCNGYFGAKVWHSTDKYRRVIWQCNHKFKNAENPCGSKKCATPHLTEEEIKSRFVIAVNILLAHKNYLASDFEEINTVLFDNTALEKEAAELQSEMTIVAEMIEKCVDDNARRKQDQGEYNQRYGGLIDRFEKAKARYTALSEQIHDRAVRRRAAESFLTVVRKQKTPLAEFDEQTWYTTVDCVTIHNDGRVVFRFKDGTEIEG